MITRKPWTYFVAMLLPAAVIFGYSYWYYTYMFGHGKASFLAYYAKSWDEGLSPHLLLKLGYSALMYSAVIIGSYELVLRAMNGRFKGDD